MKNNGELDLLISALMNIKSKEEYSEFLSGLLTPAELEELPKRLEIIRQLKQGIPQAKIAKDLGVGIATVTRGSKELKQGRFKNFS